MTAAARAMAQRRLLAAGAGHLARRGRRAGRRLQPDGRRPRRRRPAPPRADRERLARAAHADRRAAGGAGERRGRRRRAPIPPRCATALAQTERLGRLVAELLDLSADRRRAPWRCELEPSVPGRRSSSRTTVAEAKVAAPRRRSRRDVHHRDVQPPHAGRRACDRDRLHQVLVNLLDNAARHSPPGGVVTVVARTARGHGWSLEVSDEGPGIRARGPRPGLRPLHRAATRAGATAAPGWGSPSPAGRWTCTAARSSSPSRSPRGAAGSRSRCPGSWRERP